MTTVVLMPSKHQAINSHIYIYIQRLWALSTQIAKTLELTLIRYQSDNFLSDWWLIDVDPRTISVWVCTHRVYSLSRMLRYLNRCWYLADVLEISYCATKSPIHYFVDEIKLYKIQFGLYDQSTAIIVVVVLLLLLLLLLFCVVWVKWETS